MVSFTYGKSYHIKCEKKLKGCWLLMHVCMHHVVPPPQIIICNYQVDVSWLSKIMPTQSVKSGVKLS